MKSGQRGISRADFVCVVHACPRNCPRNYMSGFARVHLRLFSWTDPPFDYVDRIANTPRESGLLVLTTNQSDRTLEGTNLSTKSQPRVETRL